MVLAFNKWRIHCTCTVFKISFSTLEHVVLQICLNCKLQQVDLGARKRHHNSVSRMRNLWRFRVFASSLKCLFFRSLSHVVLQLNFVMFYYILWLFKHGPMRVVYAVTEYARRLGHKALEHVFWSRMSTVEVEWFLIIKMWPEQCKLSFVDISADDTEAISLQNWVGKPFN